MLKILLSLKSICLQLMHAWYSHFYMYNACQVCHTGLKSRGGNKACRTENVYGYRGTHNPLNSYIIY